MSFAKPEQAVAAYEALDKTSFQGRLLHILGAVDRRGNADVEGEGKKKTVKGEIQAKRKAMAGKEFNWSMLYMNVSCSLQLHVFVELMVVLERCCGLLDRR